MRRKEQRLIKLGGILLALLVCVVGSILWLEREPAATSAQEAPPTPTPVAPTPTPIAVTLLDKDWGDFATPEPTPRATHIQRKISGKLRIDAEGEEPGVPRMQTARRVPIPYDYKALPDLLFQDKQAKREVIQQGEGRYDTYNAKGEFLLVEPGRVRYSRHAPKDERSHWDQVAGYLRNKKSETRWLYANQRELDQELAFLSREEAARQAETYALSMQPKDFPFTVETVDVAAVTYPQWDAFVKALRKEQYVRFNSIPREGAQDYGGDGLYLITLHFRYQGISVFAEDSFDDIQYGRTTSRVQGSIGMSAYALVSAAGIIEYDASSLCTFAGASEVSVISLDQAVERMAAEYKEFQLDAYEDIRQFTIDRIFLKYVMLRFEEGGDHWFAWHPMWCFMDDKVEGGWRNGEHYGLYLDAITGKSILTM